MHRTTGSLLSKYHLRSACLYFFFYITPGANINKSFLARHAASCIFLCDWHDKKLKGFLFVIHKPCMGWKKNNAVLAVDEACSLPQVTEKRKGGIKSTQDWYKQDTIDNSCLAGTKIQYNILMWLKHQEILLLPYRLEKNKKKNLQQSVDIIRWDKT